MGEKKGSMGKRWKRDTRRLGGTENFFYGDKEGRKEALGEVEMRFAQSC